LDSKIKYLLFQAIIIYCIINAGSCGIFETREPESPINTRNTFFPPTTAEIVISNLTYSIQEKNSENYVKCLSQNSFQFVPDSRSQQLYEQIFNSWGHHMERLYMNNLIAAQEGGNSSAVLFLDNQQLTQLSSDSARFQADYIFVFQHNRINIPKSSKGRMILIISEDDDALFYIRRWEDFRRNDTDFTWSEFKANFSN
jgi:hypothetical protein